MKLHCPHCGVKGSADDSYNGRKVKCPKCQGVFEVTRDMSVALSEDAALLSATASTPAKFSTPSVADAAPIAPNEGSGKKESAIGLSGDEAGEMLNFDDDPAESGPAPIPQPEQELSMEEESFNWDDIASEIDLQLAEGGFGAEREEIPDGSPVDISSLQDTFDEADDETTIAPEITAIAGNDDKEIAEDEVLLVQKDNEIELEPYGLAKKQCWQCGKSDNVGESFITRDGRLYCTDCAPIEDSAKTTGINKDPETVHSDAMADATDGANDKSSLGTALKKAWAKIKGVFFS